MFLAHEKAMAYTVGINVPSHNVAMGVNPKGKREGSPGNIDRGELAVA